MRYFGTNINTDFRLLVVDDDEDMLKAIQAYLLPLGFQVHLQTQPQAALEKITSSPNEFDLVVSDLKMPELDGIELVEKIREKNSNIPILLMTAHGSEATAIQAIQKGAFDYILKPLHFEELEILIRRALKIRTLEESYQNLQDSLRSDKYFPEIIGRSPVIKDLKEIIRKVAKTDASVLIEGESGAGKELVAKAIHSSSSNKDFPFITLNCSAIPKELLESEMFGHTKGSFTGATSERSGVFQSAHKGTLFLDEIGDMPLNLQAKLLRVLQEKKIKPVGSDKEMSVDVRILSASHRNLKNEIKEGRFREDLYFRLNVFPISVPPLRTRKEDIPLLLQWFLKAQKNKKPLISEKALHKLMGYSWPGNIRELQNVVKRAQILAGESKILEKHIILEFDSVDRKDTKDPNDSFRDFPSLAGLEKSYIQFALKELGGVKEKVAEKLGIDRKTLYRKIKSYKIE